MNDLGGLVVAVTGASAGIGRECVLAFARAGARVAAAARRLDRLEALADEVRALGSEVLVVQTDVGEREQVRRFVEATVERFGRLDVLVNNAGYGVRGTVEETPVAAYERLMRVNYMGTVHGCQAAIPIMRRQRSGLIVNVSSIVGHRSLPTGGAYAATKAAQISLTESLRVELRGSGVRACSVHPVGTRTEFGEVAARESGGDMVDGVGPQQPPRVVAEAIVRCARRPRPEVYPFPAARAIVWLNALAPGLADWLAGKTATRAGRLPRPGEIV
jgi:NAD(P)-dependent dehydrogenase (short-subunit alcohol dehydrogenase family)